VAALGGGVVNGGSLCDRSLLFSAAIFVWYGDKLYGLEGL
jgi:hypothetical protein